MDLNSVQPKDIAQWPPAVRSTIFGQKKLREEIKATTLLQLQPERVRVGDHVAQEENTSTPGLSQFSRMTSSPHLLCPDILVMSEIQGTMKCQFAAQTQATAQGSGALYQYQDPMDIDYNILNDLRIYTPFSHPRE